MLLVNEAALGVVKSDKPTEADIDGDAPEITGKDVAPVVGARSVALTVGLALCVGDGALDAGCEDSAGGDELVPSSSVV